jgi:hypothetical protein
MTTDIERTIKVDASTANGHGGEGKKLDAIVAVYDRHLATRDSAVGSPSSAP